MYNDIQNHILTAVTKPAASLQCRHIFTDGRRCAGPCLRGEDLCYHHHTTRRPIENPAQRKARLGTFDIPMPEDRSAIQLSIGEILQRIASNDLDPRRAGLLLYGLQIASLNLPKPPQPDRKSKEDNTYLLVEDTTEHPTMGTLAPVAEIGSLEPKGTVSQLLEDMRKEEEEALQREREDLKQQREDLNRALAELELQRRQLATDRAALESQCEVTLPTIQATAAASTLDPKPWPLDPRLQTLIPIPCSLLYNARY